jgi:hypothetical protein
MKSRALIGVLVLGLLAPIVLVASGGDPRTIWGEFERMIGGNLVAYAVNATMPVAFGGDDTGTVVTFDAKRLKCQNAAVKNYAHLVACILQCHVKAAEALSKQKPFDEEACESTDPAKSCRAKYDKTSAKIVAMICPPCLVANQASVADDIELKLDNDNQNFYCYP